MAHKSIKQARTWSVGLFLALLLFAVCIPAGIRAEIKHVTLRFCVQDDAGNAVLTARITGKNLSGGREFTIKRLPDEDCYAEEVNIDDAKIYTFTFEAEGLQKREHMIAGSELLKNPNQTESLPKDNTQTGKPAPSAPADPKSPLPENTPHNRDATAATQKNSDEGTEAGAPGIVRSSLNFVVAHWLAASLLGLMMLTGVLWMAGFRVTAYRMVDNQPMMIGYLENAIQLRLRPLAENIQVVKTNQEALSKQQQVMQRAIERLPLIQPPPVLPQEATPLVPLPLMLAAPSAREDGKRSAVPQPARRDIAQSAYRQLVQGSVLSQAPIYLNAEANSSPIDMLADNQVYLEEVSNKQGSFVLFKDSSDDLGYVFPNPRLKFRQQALSPVFPGITESQFGSDKENIQPVLAGRVGANRWKVESAC